MSTVHTPAVPRWWLAVIVGAAVVAFRFLTFDGFENDYFSYLSKAYQVLLGHWPVWDFEDPGYPLTYLLSSAAALAFGQTQLTEVLLCCVLLGGTAGLTYALAARAGNSPLIGMIAAGLLVAMSARLYNSTKVFVPAVAIALAWHYADTPNRRNLLILAGWTAVAFLFRHDYGLYLGLAGLMLIALQHRDDPALAGRHALLFAAGSTLAVLPWIVYVQWAAGLDFYLAASLRWFDSEWSRTAEAWPSFRAGPLFQMGNLDAPVFYGLLALSGLSLLGARRPAPLPTAGHLAYVATLSGLMVVVFLRDVVTVRLPDVMPVVVLLGAWWAGRLLAPGRRQRVWRLAAYAGLAALAALTYQYGRLPPVFSMAASVRAKVVGLQTPFRDVPAPGGLAAAVERIQQCTAADQGVLVSGFGPEIPIFAGRPFAGGFPTHVPGYADHPDDLARIRTRLAADPPGAVVMLEGFETFEETLPELGDWLEEAGLEPVAVSVPDAATQLFLTPCPSSEAID